jgi:hypothetical protein
MRLFHLLEEGEEVGTAVLERLNPQTFEFGFIGPSPRRRDTEVLRHVTRNSHRPDRQPHAYLPPRQLDVFLLMNGHVSQPGNSIVSVRTLRKDRGGGE